MASSRRTAPLSFATVLAVGAAACGGRPAPPRETDVLIGRPSSRPNATPAALARFRPAQPAPDTSGVCEPRVMRIGSGRQITMWIPDRATARATIAAIFDSTGRLVRSSERRGVIAVRTPGGAKSMEEVRRAFDAAEAAVRTTMLSFDYVIDQALLTNRGGGQADETVMARASEAGALESLGRPRARLDAMIARCGAPDAR